MFLIMTYLEENNEVESVLRIEKSWRTCPDVTSMK